MLLKHFLEEGLYLHTRTVGKLFNPFSLKVKTNIKNNIIKDILFVDDAAVAGYSPRHIRYLMD